MCKHVSFSSWHLEKSKTKVKKPKPFGLPAQTTIGGAMQGCKGISDYDL